MHGDCDNCKNRNILHPSSYNGAQRVTCVQRTTKDRDKSNTEENLVAKITVKQTIENSLEELVERFHTYLSKFRRHLFNIRQQYAYYCWLRSCMPRNECLIHNDFSDNFSCNYSTEIQTVHFGASHQQATLHTGVIYVGGSHDNACFTSISSSKHKTPPAIWEHLKPALDHVENTHQGVGCALF